MRNYSALCYGLATAFCLTVIAASSAIGDDIDKNKNPAKKRDAAGIGKIDSKTTGTNIRASKLIGTNIQNKQGESVGSVSDIVLDASTGKVRYMAVTYGGFLGLGNKMFAVPYEAFETRQEADDPDETILVLSVTEQQLEGSVGFDEDTWPNFADTKFTSEVDKRYGVERRRRLGNRGVDVEVDRDGVNVDVDAKRDRDE